MALHEILNLVWINIKENKTKVLLTSLGIIVGAATIVIVIAIGLGGQKDVQDQFKNLNAGTITIADNSGPLPPLAEEGFPEAACPAVEDQAVAADSPAV